MSLGHNVISAHTNPHWKNHKKGLHSNAIRVKCVGGVIKRGGAITPGYYMILTHTSTLGRSLKKVTQYCH